MVVITYDDREKTDVPKFLELYGKVVRKRLNEGDYINEFLSVGIERKEINDFVQSFLDSRKVERQVNDLLAKYTHVYLIISGNSMDVRNNLHNNVVLGMIASLAVKSKAQVLMVNDDMDCAYLISRIMEKYKEQRMKELCLGDWHVGIECKTTAKEKRGKKLCDRCEEIIKRCEE